MPAPPKIRNARCNIGIIEVFGKVKAEHSPQPDRHIRIAGKIKIEVQGVKNDLPPSAERARGERKRRPKIEMPCGKRIAEQHLFAKPHAKTFHSGGKIRKFFASPLNFGCNFAVAHDRPGNELWEKRNIGAETCVIALQFGVSAVKVYRIGEDLKGVKGNADRQAQAEERNVPKRQARKGCGGKIVIFEEKEKEQTDRNRKDRPKAGAAGF